MARERIILAVIDRMTQYGRGVLAGISQYIATSTDLTVYPFRPNSDSDVDGEISAMRPDGIISRGNENDPWCQKLRDAGVPLVLVAHTRSVITDPAVLPDYHAIGRMGAEHLIGQGYRRLIFRGSAYVTLQQIERGFLDAATAAGCQWDALDFLQDPPMSDASMIERQLDLLRRQNGPVGVMTPGDDSAIKMMMSARMAGLTFGRDIAVLGMGNDILLCECCRPTMSSIALPLEQIGFKAAQLMHQLLDGEPPPPEPIRLQPTRVVVRGSTDLAATDDIELAQAVHFIHERFRQRLSVPLVAEHVGLSRRTLERRFQKHLGRTVDAEIRRQRVEQAKRMLVDTDLALKRIAQLCGFARPEQLSRTFKQVTNCSPITFRKDHTPS